MVLIVAATLRLWQIGDIPAGLYRDEAANGLDAVDVLEGRRRGENPFYFSTNNGREPIYIYLTTLFVSFMDRSAAAVRIAAAIIGTFTTIPIFLLAESWFERRVALFSSWLWATTLWTLHLSRIGLRPILLPMFLTISFWLGTLAYRRQREGLSAEWLWLFGGAVYGLSFYTYLAARFTPVLLAAVLAYLILRRRHKPLWPGIILFLLTALVVAAPLILLVIQQPEVAAGRLGQVSVLGAAADGSSSVSALWQNLWSTLGMFVVKGDTIVRHNPPGRAVFDIVMLIPFLVGVIWSIRNSRKTAYALLLLWLLIMLGPTILAEDAPHFLRSVGILPAAVIVPAIGLSQIWTWPKLPSRLGPALVLGICLVSLGLTIKDYFIDYGRDQVTGYWFEAAARSLAEDINGQSRTAKVLVDDRYWEGWPSVRFLLKSPEDLEFYNPETLQSGTLNQPGLIYAWPYEGLEQVTSAIASPALTGAQRGAMAQGDLETEPYALYARYEVDEPVSWPILAHFGNTIQLRKAEVSNIGTDQIQVDLYWSTDEKVDPRLSSFVHVLDGEEIMVQSDGTPGDNFWPSQWWRPGLIVRDRHILPVNDNIQDKKWPIRVGLYNADTLESLEVRDSNGNPIGESFLLSY